MKQIFHKKLALKKVTISKYLFAGTAAAPDLESDPIRSSAFHDPTEVLSDFPSVDETDQSQNTTLISGNQQTCL